MLNNSITDNVINILTTLFALNKSDNNKYELSYGYYKPCLFTNCNDKEELASINSKNINQIDFDKINSNLDDIFNSNKNDKTNITTFNNKNKSNILLDTNKQRMIYKTGEQIVFIEKNKLTIIPEFCITAEEEEEEYLLNNNNKNNQILKDYDENKKLTLQNYIAWEIYNKDKSISSKIIFHKEPDDSGQEINITTNNKKATYTIENSAHDLFITFQNEKYKAIDDYNNQTYDKSCRYSLQLKKTSNKSEPFLTIGSNIILGYKSLNRNKDETQEEAKNKHEGLLKELQIQLSPFQEETNSLHKSFSVNKEEDNIFDCHCNSLEQCCDRVKTSLIDLYDNIMNKLFN